MTKKLTMAGIALAAAFAFAFVAIGSADHATACDKAAKNASASTCTKSASAKTASAGGCDKSAAAKTASAGGCDKSAAAKTASAGGCDKSAAAKTASAGGCDKSAAAKTASAGGCDKSAAVKTASAGGCDKSAAAKTASNDCCKGMNAVAGYSKSGNAKCDSKECSALECDSKYAAALNNVVDEIPQAERTRVVLTGSIECGHCTYDAVDTCQPLLKTTDGKVYPMLHSNLVKAMRKSGSAQVEVTSNVRNAHGVKYLDVKTFKAL